MSFYINEDHAHSPSLQRRHFFKQSLLGSMAFMGATGRCLSAMSEERETKSEHSPIIDTHIHIWANDFVKYPLKKGVAKPPTEATVEMLVEEMDAQKIDHCVIVQVIYHGWDNSYVADVQQQFPNRFRTQGLIDPTDPKVADKLSYWVEERGLHGMRFSPIYYEGKDDWLTSPAHHELWKRADKLGAVFNFFIKTHQLPKLEEMVKTYPNVKVAIDHFAYVEINQAQSQHEFNKLLKLAKYPNVSCKLSEMCTVSKTLKYPYEDTFPYVQQLFEAFGAERLMWGTGFPGSSRAVYKRPSLTAELDLVRKHLKFLTVEDQQKILGQNAYKFWNFGTSS